MATSVSSSGSISKYDIFGCLRTAAIVAVGVFIETFLTSVGGLDLGPYRGIVTTVSASLIEMVRRFVKDYS